MTREENTAKLAQLRSETEALVKDYNDAIQNGKFEDASKADKAMTEKINEYTATVRDMCFEDCKNTDNPMLTAVTTLSFVTIGVKDEQKGDDKVPVRAIVDKERQIDLLKLHKYCGSIGANENWSSIAQKMNFLLTAQKAVDLGIDPKAVNDSYEDYWFKVVGDTKDELTKKYMEMCMVSVTEVVYSNKEQVLGIKRLFPFNYDVIMPDDTELKDMLESLVNEVNG